MCEEENSSENKTVEKPSIWDAKPVTAYVTKSAKSKDNQNKAIKKNYTSKF